jgi:hydrogenase maturation protein HypF
MPDSVTPGLVRERVRVRGIVQGVGFRPFVYRLAGELGLAGWVRNDSEGVLAEVQGEPAAVSAFAQRIAEEAPPLARVGSVERRPLATIAARGFVIGRSRHGTAATAITPDAATCPDCLREMLDPSDRRYRYPFINCTHCGPRFTIATGVPYDRSRTTMAPFRLCADCEREYRDPLDRRFHAQPVACPACGPKLSLLDARGRVVTGADPLEAAVRLLREGRIVALKGLGGFHLACDAADAAAVSRLRGAKNREEKPFAVMVAGVADLEGLARLDAEARALLEAHERPIVLLPKAPGCDLRLPGVAPGMAAIGAMLPYTPLHHLLFALDPHSPRVLVMTSANPGGEPLVFGNEEAVARLSGIAEAFLVHDRGIFARCDDSVLRAAGPSFVRRSRGYTPAAIRLAKPDDPVLAVGAELKNTACVTRGEDAFLSAHIGDLDNAAGREAFDEAVSHLLAILEVEPVAVAHDLHPDFHATRFAARFARERNIPAIGVQHHHAHIAAVCAEHGFTAPVLGLALDGVGLGTDGAAWGGELLLVEGARFRRLGHLGTLALPGGDRAAREPWRMAAAALHALGRTEEIAQRFPRRGAGVVATMLEKGVRSPMTSSAGRWFDAAAGLLGLRETSSFEAQAAMELEALAHRHGAVSPLAGAWRITPEGVLDLLPLAACLAGQRDAAYGAALFHATLGAALVDWTSAAADREGLSTIALGGGCFLNALLSSTVAAGLRERGLAVLEARAAPANDGGIALGQAWVAMQAGG